MIYTELTNKALRIAYAAHHGQVDKCGIPYIFHPYQLAQAMDDEISCCAALLHDVVEDTDVTMEELEKEFPRSITEVLRLLTHDPDEEYFRYVRRIKDHPIAKKVKLADLAHNSDQSRCVGSDIPAEALARWKKKYDKARQILLED